MKNAVHSHRRAVKKRKPKAKAARWLLQRRDGAFWVTHSSYTAKGISTFLSKPIRRATKSDIKQHGGTK